MKGTTRRTNALVHPLLPNLKEKLITPNTNTLLYKLDVISFVIGVEEKDTVKVLREDKPMRI